MSTKKQSNAAKRVHRRNVSRSTINTTSEGSGSDALSSVSTEQDEFERQKAQRQDSLKQSQAYVEEQGRNFESRDQRHYRLMNVFEK